MKKRIRVDIVHERLYNHHLVGTKFETPQEVVKWLGAVQAQEYAGAKWGISQRIKSITETEIDKAFAQGEILRTHVMRPTWHFVTPADIRWMLKLTGPRVNKICSSYYRKLKLDDSVFAKSNAIIKKSLKGKQLTRQELAIKLQQSGLRSITEERIRLSFLMMRAELDGLICSGALQGKQHTYALLDERVPKTISLKRDEALAELTKRYFSSHGPATLKDFSWWSGLTVADAKAGLEMIKHQFEEEVIDGKSFWFSPDVQPEKKNIPVAHLIPVYDEYTIAYKNHPAILDPKYLKQIVAGNGIVIILDGRVVGTWKRTLTKSAVIIDTNLFIELSESKKLAIINSAKNYTKYLGMPGLLRFGRKEIII